MKKIVLAVLVLLKAVGLALGQTGDKKKTALPHEYGSSVISNYSAQAGLATV